MIGEEKMTSARLASESRNTLRGCLHRLRVHDSVVVIKITVLYV